MVRDFETVFDMNKHLFIGILMISKKMKQCFMSENCFI